MEEGDADFYLDSSNELLVNHPAVSSSRWISSNRLTAKVEEQEQGSGQAKQGVNMHMQEAHEEVNLPTPAPVVVDRQVNQIICRWFFCNLSNQYLIYLP